MEISLHWIFSHHKMNLITRRIDACVMGKNVKRASVRSHKMLIFGRESEIESIISSFVMHAFHSEFLHIKFYCSFLWFFFTHFFIAQSYDNARERKICSQSYYKIFMAFQNEIFLTFFFSHFAIMEHRVTRVRENNGN